MMTNSDKARAALELIMHDWNIPDSVLQPHISESTWQPYCDGPKDALEEYYGEGEVQS
jgi:hypothetical protein